MANYQEQLDSIYDTQRQKLKQRNLQDVQARGQALERRFAALGGLNSGAAIKSLQQNEESGAQDLEQGMADIAAAQAQSNLQAQNIKEEREFQSSEAQKARDAQQAQFEKSYGLSQKQFDLQSQIAQWDQESKGKALDLAYKQFEEDKKNSLYNKVLSAAQLDDPSAFANALSGMGLTIDNEGNVVSQQMAQGNSNVMPAKLMKLQKSFNINVPASAWSQFQ